MSRLQELVEELCPNGVEYKKLGEVATISRGGSFQKKDFVESGVPCIHYGQIYTRYGMFPTETFTFINSTVAEKQKFAEPGDVVMAVTSENIEDICKCVAWLGNERAAISGHSAIIHHTLNPKYLVYYLHSAMFYQQKAKLAHGTKVMEVKPDDLKGIRLPVPPLEVQCEIVRMLDSFTLLSDELEKELSERQTQYNFYLNKIFSVENAKLVRLNEVAKEQKNRNKGQTIKEAFSVTQRGIIPTSEFFGEKTNITSENTTNYLVLKPNWFAYSPSRIDVGSFNYLRVDHDVIISPLNKMFSVDENVILPSYLYMYFCSAKGNKDMLRYREGIEGTGRWHLNFSDMSKMMIPIPSIECQMKIVNKINVLKEYIDVLSREIELRNKQSEYYRNKLLSFRELGA